MRQKYIFSEQEKNLIFALYEIGLKDEAVARVFRCERNTLIKRLKENGLLNTIKNIKGIADSKVEASLYNQALKGNITAIIFWLCNRQPDKWKNVNKVDIQGTLQIPKVIVGKPAELKDIKAEEEKYDE